MSDVDFCEGSGPLPVIADELLRGFAERLLDKGGAGPDAGAVATSLVEANLRGHDSHGVMRIPSYLDRVERGMINPGTRLDVLNETASTLVGDGGWGFGQVVARELMERLLKKTEDSGIVCGTIRRAAHIGRLGEYAEMAAERGLVGLVCVNNNGSGQRVSPIGGKRPRLGTNPICISVPGGESGPFVLDIGTSATAEGKVRVKRIAGEQTPSGWLLDSDGNPTTDPETLYGDPPGTILPLGGDQAYKGFGLAFMIELLAGGLSGGRCVHPDAPMPVGNCGVFILVAPAALGGADHLLQEVRQVEEYVRGVPRIDGVTSVTLPGDPERSVLDVRRADGVPLDDGNWQALLDLAGQLGVTDVPAAS